MVRRLFQARFWGIVLVLLLAGCDQADRLGTTAEVDDPGYKRGKELRRQGRYQEALASFLKVIERRGDDSAESHLEAGLLYREYFKSPIDAIYHFRKCCELKPNSPTAELVKPQIVAATKDFALTLPGDPLSNAVIPRIDTYGQMDKLQRENQSLKAEVTALRMQLAAQANAAEAKAARSGDLTVSVAPGTDAARDLPLRSPAGVAAAGANPFVGVAPVTTPPPPAPTPTPAPPAAAKGRKHVVAKGDTLFKLSERYYGGNRSRWRDIFAANASVMKSPNDLPLGAELVIPP